MSQSKKQLILIVDDNPRNLQVLGAIMSEAGYNVAVVIKSPQALTFCEKERPDLILLDVMMPEMDGYEVCQKLKENKRTKAIPVIFITAKREEEDIVKGFDVGGVDYVIKPFNIRELLARVKTHIELRQAREEIKTLRGIIPICSTCHKIRDDEGYWQQVDGYLKEHSEVEISHGICPECVKKLYGDEPWFESYQEARKQKDQKTDKPE